MQERKEQQQQPAPLQQPNSLQRKMLEMAGQVSRIRFFFRIRGSCSLLDPDFTITPEVKKNYISFFPLCQISIFVQY
jgi:hypothetical protein